MDDTNKLFTITIEAGCLIRSHLRNLLEEIKFRGYNLDYRENKSFLESNFTVRALKSVLLALKETTNSWESKY